MRIYNKNLLKDVLLHVEVHDARYVPKSWLSDLKQDLSE